MIDVNGYVSRHVRDSALLLKDAVEYYIYISTGAVYEIPFPANRDKRIPIRTTQDEASEDVPAHYGALKALCERAAQGGEMLVPCRPEDAYQ